MGWTIASDMVSATWSPAHGGPQILLKVYHKQKPSISARRCIGGVRPGSALVGFCLTNRERVLSLSALLFQAHASRLAHPWNDVYLFRARTQGCCKIILAACGGSQKEQKRFLRGHPAPRQRAAALCTPAAPFYSRSCNSPSAESRNLLDNGERRFIGTTKMSTNPFS
jgi:hypothetical protein